MEEDRYSCDVLVIGSGAAGCRAAIEASEHSADVILVAKGVFGKSGTTNLACVVYDAALGHADPKDSPQTHFEDSIIYSRFLAGRAAPEGWPNKSMTLRHPSSLTSPPWTSGAKLTGLA